MNFWKKICAGWVGFSLALVFSSTAAMEFKEAEITTLKNLVEHDPGTGSAPAKVNEKIGEKSKVSTAAASMAELMFADSSITRMGANTQFSFQSKERLVKLESGTVLVHTPPGNGGATVDCGGVTGAVSGTTFMASRDSSGNVMFVLLEGQGGLKVTVGGASTVLKPGQAASVGSDTIKEAKSASPVEAGGTKPAADGTTDDNKPSGGGPGPAASTPAGEGGETPAPATPKIQVFEVDVKKVMTTSPLVTDFKNELPSVSKIETTIEVQQKAVQEGKLEKLDVEVVAVKSTDGDLMVGAPRVEREEMLVVNSKEKPGGPGARDNLDIDTAAGPGAGGPGGDRTAAAPLPPTREGVASLPSAPALPPIDPGVTGGRGQQAALPPSSLDLVLGLASGSVTLDRGLLTAQTANFSGLPFPGLAMGSGATTASFPVDPKQYFLGFDSAMALITTRPVTASIGDLRDTAIFTHDLAAVQRANPVRLLYSSPSGGDLTALDAFFYFTGKPADVLSGPSRFFADASVSGTDRTLAAPGAKVEIYGGQAWDLYAARKFSQISGPVLISDLGNRKERVDFATTVDVGSAAGQWQLPGPGPVNDTTVNFFYLSQNAAYLPVFDATIQDTKEPVGFLDPFGALLVGKENFPIWEDADGALSTSGTVLTALSGMDNWTLASGSGGTSARGLHVNAGGASVDLLSTGDLKLEASLITDAGKGAGQSLALEGRGKVKVGGSAPEEQVRLEGRTDAAGDALAGSLAVVRTGDSLELRNVVIRGFSETSLEKRNVTTRALEGRVLISGSAVRDFKIKELVGTAVNADAKIQMMALDAGGNLAGDMVVEGKLPVQAKVASALAAIGETLPSATANTMVDAQQIDVAARNLKFENANLAAMNAITARANTILIQNSFMTVVRNQGMINMYVQSGLVNTTYGSMVDGRLNFAGLNRFQIGNNSFEIGNQAQLTANYGSNVVDITHNGNSPQAGKLNVLKL